jgi:aminomethyltransferase
MSDLKRLPLHDLHSEHGAKFVPFAGYEMPVQFSAGVMAEHVHTRTQAGLFDVSHMGQVVLLGDQAAALEALVPVDVIDLAEGRQRYALFTNDAGGVLDDLMIANRGDHLLLVVNAACKDADIAHISAHLDNVEPIEDRALLALQGPAAEAALARLAPDVAAMKFMDVRNVVVGGAELWVSRSGYTGEDGYEISIPVNHVDAIARALLAMDEVLPIGLGARDSLRLEAGLPLYGQDLATDVTPIEAGLGWAISKCRRTGGAREGGFPGAEVILMQHLNGAPRRRVGLRPDGRAPMRDGVQLYDAADGGRHIGQITSGGFGPSVGGPIALGLIAADVAKDVTLYGEVRGKRLPATQTKLPFQIQTYKR